MKKHKNLNNVEHSRKKNVLTELLPTPKRRMQNVVQTNQIPGDSVALGGTV